MLFIILGSVLEGIPAIVLFGPLLFPIAQTFGVDEVQYAIVAVLAMGIGLFSPPVGSDTTPRAPSASAIPIRPSAGSCPISWRS